MSTHLQLFRRRIKWRGSRQADMRWVGQVPLVRIGATRPPAQLTRGDGESEGKRRETLLHQGGKKREKAGEKQCHQPAHHSTDAATLSRFFSSRTPAPPAGRRISVDPRSSRCLAGISRRRPVSATRVHDASTMCVWTTGMVGGWYGSMVLRLLHHKSRIRDIPIRSLRRAVRQPMILR